MRNLLLLVGFLNASLAFGQSQNNEWENQEVFERNKEKAHATFILYDNSESARKGDEQTSPYYKLLNGKWKFNLVKKPSERPENFHQVNFNDTGWDENTVPSIWEIEGYDIPNLY